MPSDITTPGHYSFGNVIEQKTLFAFKSAG